MCLYGPTASITVNELLIPIGKIVIFLKKIKQFLYVHKEPP